MYSMFVIIVEYVMLLEELCCLNILWNRIKGSAQRRSLYIQKSQNCVLMNNEKFIQNSFE